MVQLRRSLRKESQKSRGLAKKAAPRKSAGPTQVVPKEQLEGIVHGLNIFKDSPDEVKVKPDSEYPDWVFTLHMPRATLEELTTEYERDAASFTPQDTQRLYKQWNRRRIKEENASKKKK